MKSGGLQKVQGADGVGIEIIKGPRGSEVMARLGCSVDDELRFQRLDAFEDCFPISDVEFVMVEARMGTFQPLLIPSRVTLRAEKVGPHVVVDSVDLPAESGKISNDFRADETGRTGNEEFHSD